MAFGFFKKKDTADIIYKNGNIYTQDPDFPWAEAVACKDGKVMAVGDFDGMEEIIADDTQVVDLKEQFLFPGFIEGHNTDILKAFEGMYLEIDPVWDLDTVLEETAAYAEETDKDIIFAYGYNETILEDFDEAEEVQRLLDEIEEERPVLLLGISGVHCWFNTVAAEIINQTAEDAGMQYISADFILSVLEPIAFEEAENAVLQSMNQLCDRGITSIFPLNTPDYFMGIYQSCLISLIGEGITLKQRLFSSLYINRPLSPDLILHKLTAARTNCIKLDNMITADFLKLEVSDDQELAYFPEDALRVICQTAADRGYHIHLDALDQPSEERAAEVFTWLRDKGCKNNTFVLAADRSPADTEKELFLSTWPTDYLNQSVYAHADNTGDAIDLLTSGAAEMLGISKEYGSIEQGKRADFTVFEENPLDKNLKYFSSMHAAMTIVDSQVVYDLENACDEEMYDLLVSMRL